MKEKKEATPQSQKNRELNQAEVAKRNYSANGIVEHVGRKIKWKHVLI